MTKYWAIIAGIIILAMAAVALIKSQQSQLEKTQNATADQPSGVPSETPKTTSSQPKDEGIPLTITQPENDAVVASAQILVRGKTKPKAEVFINEKELVADEAGNFSTTLTLDEGENLIIITVNDAQGNIAETELVVTYNNEE